MKTLLSTFAAVVVVLSAARDLEAQGGAPQSPPPSGGAADTGPVAPIPPPSSAEAPPAPPAPTPPPAPPSPIAAAAAASPPPAAPASEGGGPGPVERLPPSAYPEEYTRGLYGGSLWSTFHGVQWPYYARTGIGVSGYGWIDNSFERINVGLPSSGTDYTQDHLQQGRILLRVTPTYANGDWFVQAQAELVANKDQSQTQMS